MIQDCIDKGVSFVHDFKPSGAAAKWDEDAMRGLVQRADETELLLYPEPFDNFNLSLRENEAYTTIDIRLVEGVKVFILEKVVK